MAERSNKIDFIKKAIVIHGDQYDYSQVVYVNNRTKVLITCKQCGSQFLQSPGSHLAGCGCPKCCNKQTHRRVAQDQYISKALQIHNSKFDYSQTQYVDMHKKIKIICPQHGVFEQIAYVHIQGSGCPKCKGEKTRQRLQYNTEYFVSKASEVHNNKYNYSMVDYRGWNKKVKIICPIHGEFNQSPSEHLKGHGCVKCANSHEDRKLNVFDFFERAKILHQNKYNYVHFVFRDYKTKGMIECPKHGFFWQSPADHLSGRGCMKCKDDKTRQRFLSNTDDFIYKARKVHGDFYDYSLIDYKSTKEKVRVICPIHGEFLQTPNAHLHKYGCPKCGADKTIKAHIGTTERFIEKAKEIHGNKYDYSKVEYQRNCIKVCIICPKHGEFFQTPNSHLLGNGCHKCKQTKGEVKIEKFLLDKNIQYQAEFVILSPGYHRRLFKVDFWLPKLYTIIEYNGIQHYEPINFMGGHKRLEGRQKRDNDLIDYCSKNKINIIVIPYTDFNEIESALNDKLSL